MNPILFIITIIIVGLSGLVAQVLLLRELLVSFYGNELTLGVVLGNWVATEALGAFLGGNYINRFKNKVNVFIVLELIFSLVLPVSVFLSRAFKVILGITAGEAVGLYAVFLVSLIVILPAAFSHGALFSVGCKIYSLDKKETADSLGKVYAWETLGTILGSVVLTWLFLPFLDTFAIVFALSLANLSVCLGFRKNRSGKKLNYAVLATIILLFYLFSSGRAKDIERFSIGEQFKLGQVLDYRNSIYGNIAVIKNEGQYTFFYNGSPVITAPFPDANFVEDFGNLPLLFHPQPEKILIISAGAGGLIKEALKYPIRSLDYVELDPLIIAMLKKYPNGLTEYELGDRRVNTINTDGRYFLKSNPKTYDLVLIGLTDPSGLSANRLFTLEFFSLVKTRLKAGGILAFCLPGSLTYLSRELRGLNASILGGLKKTYSCVRVIPGDYNIFLSSDSGSIMQVSADLISERIRERDIKANILTPTYLDYRLSSRWQDWFARNLAGSIAGINRDLKPVAVFEMLKFSNKKFSSALANILETAGNLNLKWLAFFVFLLTAVFYWLSRSRQGRLDVLYCLFTTGFFGMLTNLMLIFSFQVFYGYLYYMIGILMSLFMAGAAVGSISMTASLRKIMNSSRLFAIIEILIILFSFIAASLLVDFGLLGRFQGLIFIVLFIASGFLMGLQFPLAGKIYLEKAGETGKASGALYAADLAGGWLAGLLGGIILLPVLGLFSTFLVIIVFKLSSLFLFSALNKSLL